MTNLDRIWIFGYLMAMSFVIKYPDSASWLAVASAVSLISTAFFFMAGVKGYKE